VVKIILANLEDAWRPVHEVSVEFVRSEINPQFATIVPPSDVVVVISFEVELENSLGSMTLALPYATIEPIRTKHYAAFQTERLEVDHAWISRFRDRLLETPVDVSVTFGTTQSRGRQLLDMRIGDILLLDQDEDDLLLAQGSRYFEISGTAGFVKGNKAFKVLKEQELNY
jgi:flagellar motor switch protein FliM